VFWSEHWNNFWPWEFAVEQFLLEQSVYLRP